MANPYPKTKIDETSGIEFKNIEYEVFEEGRTGGLNQAVEWMINPYPTTTIDEASGIKVKNVEYEAFEEGRRDGIKRVAGWLEKHNRSPLALTIAKGS